MRVNTPEHGAFRAGRAVHWCISSRTIMPSSVGFGAVHKDAKYAYPSGNSSRKTRGIRWLDLRLLDPQHEARAGFEAVSNAPEHPRNVWLAGGVEAQGAEVAPAVVRDRRRRARCVSVIYRSGTREGKIRSCPRRMRICRSYSMLKAPSGYRPEYGRHGGHRSGDRAYR
jgi:hypothetical protein